MIDLRDLARNHGFTLLKSEDLPEIDGSAYTMLHELSGARLLYLKNDDNNKAFSIAFKTPPADDTGVFHILEHSVLCGSDKFPVKEPFVNLLKSSMQTFLNALTFPDKTMYPVASTNEQDLENLMDVYLDAVFHPAIYHKPTIFEQEGWHVELTESQPSVVTQDTEEVQREEENASEGNVESPEASANATDGSSGAEVCPIMLNGVVYNEMKGALSDPDTILYNVLAQTLFPDTTYRFESGGTPASIPDLTYESFLDSHRRHYRTDNSYITLYGNLDIERFLAFIDQRYLTPLVDEQRKRDAAATTSALPNSLEPQTPVKAFGVRRTMATTPDNACAAMGYVLGDATQRTRLIAIDILLDAIMGSNESPMKRVLLDAGIAADALGYTADSMLQPLAIIQLKGLRPGCAPRLQEIVEAEARRLSEGELDHDLVEAAISHAEFTMRERDFGIADGVALAMTALSGWLYDDGLSTAYLHYEDDFKYLREQLDKGYFEKLIREIFLESNHCAQVEVVPVEKAEEDPEAERLEAWAKTLTPEACEDIRRDVESLREAQETPDSPEALATLPHLYAYDIGPAGEEPTCVLDETGSLPCLRHGVNTHGIVYMYRYFDLNRVSYEELPYVSILTMVLSKLDTESHTAAELDTLIQSKLGNLSFYTDLHEDSEQSDAFDARFVVGVSALSENLKDALDIPTEVMLTTNFEDTGKIYNILLQRRVAMEQGFAMAGQTTALGRVASYYLKPSVIREKLLGIDFYYALRELTDNFDIHADELVEKLAELAHRLFTDDGCVFSFGGSAADYERLREAGMALGVKADVDASRQRLEAPEPVVGNEAFIVPADVSFSSMGYDRRFLNADYNGSWRVAARILSYDYLWNEVRVKGGAYGAGFQTLRQGNMRFYSYRDPHIDETFERFAQAGAWLAEFDPDEVEMDGYVVSTTAAIDAPEKPRKLIRRQDAQYFGHVTLEERLKIREEVIATKPEDVRALGPLITAMTDKNLRCTVGSREIIEAAETPFKVIELLG